MFVVSALLLLQIGVTIKSQADTGAAARARATRDSARMSRDSVRHAMARQARRIPLTPELEASAYRDARSRDIITRARAARLTQDSTLTAYDAMSRQRISAGLSIGGIGRERLAFRSENASRVRWQQGVGVRIDVVGARTAIPMAFPGARVLEGMMEANAIPYFPGREGLLRFTGVERVTQEDRGLFINPLAAGSESYYQFTSGDSVSYDLPTGKRIQLREVRVIARKPRWDLIVGSLWFDLATAQPVRAVYRPSATFDILAFAREDDPNDKDVNDIPLLVKPLIEPMELKIAAFTVEYGLHDGRWWLPRLQTVEGTVRVGFMRMPMSAEESFRYNSVNGTEPLAPIVLTHEDSLGRRRTHVGVNVGGSDNRHARRDSLGNARLDRGDGEIEGLGCPKGDTLTRTRLRYGRTLPVQIRIPCDTAMLAHSPELPPSIFDPADELFGTRERDELVKDLSMSLQPGWGPQRPTLYYGLERGLVRYNRVEALSVGVGAEQVLGRGYTAAATARLGVGDWQPNGELQLRRDDGRRTIGIGAYRRLSASNDWNDPFSVGSSTAALLFGRDEGFYYRDWGAELTGTQQGGLGSTVTWRLFGEQQRRANLETQFSLAHPAGGRSFAGNIVADRATEAGLQSTIRRSFGLDPHGLRASTDLELEGATGTFDYTRAALELTLSHGLGERLDGAITGGAGTTGGTVPAQRLWYLGGVQTVRGQYAGAQAGNAYWLGRFELGSSFNAARPVVFYDMGWAGNRTRWSSPGKPMAGAGAGVSFLDGIFRVDVAKGIRPDKGWRTDFYLEARF